MVFVQQSGAAIFPELEVGEATKDRPQKCSAILVERVWFLPFRKASEIGQFRKAHPLRLIPFGRAVRILGPI
jgi:hypothetical protein